MLGCCHLSYNLYSIPLLSLAQPLNRLWAYALERAWLGAWLPYACTEDADAHSSDVARYREYLLTTLGTAGASNVQWLGCGLREYGFKVSHRLLLNDCDREDEVARTDIVDYIYALYNLAEAGVYTVEVLGVHTVVADEKL
jgi:hypothetical protein